LTSLVNRNTAQVKTEPAIPGRVLCFCLGLVLSLPVFAQQEGFTPVTQAMLEKPDPADWLMFSRTYDAQRFSPLDQIDRSNVNDLGLAWSLGLPAGVTETIPTVYDGVMYLTMPDASIVALDATTGDLIWRHTPEIEGRGAGRSKTMSIYQDMVYFGASDAKGGGVENGAKIFSQATCHHRPEVYGGISERDCAELLKNFFKTLRN